MSDDHHYEANDAGSADTYPLEAGKLRKGHYAMLKGKPCKIAEITISKTGKHGHAKANMVGIDIFTDKKYEDMCPTSHNMYIPNVTRQEYTVMDIDEDAGSVSVLTETGDCKDDLNLPTNTDGSQTEIAGKMIQMFADGKAILVTVVSACKEEKIVECREATQ